MKLLIDTHILLWAAADELPPLHRDPFDRILLAQSASEGIPLLTSDSALAQYPGSLIFIRT